MEVVVCFPPGFHVLLWRGYAKNISPAKQKGRIKKKTFGDVAPDFGSVNPQACNQGWDWSIYHSLGWIFHVVVSLTRIAQLSIQDKNEVSQYHRREDPMAGTLPYGNPILLAFRSNVVDSVQSESDISMGHEHHSCAQQFLLSARTTSEWYQRWLLLPTLCNMLRYFSCVVRYCLSKRESCAIAFPATFDAQVFKGIARLLKQKNSWN